MRNPVLLLDDIGRSRKERPQLGPAYFPIDSNLGTREAHLERQNVLRIERLADKSCLVSSMVQPTIFVAQEYAFGQGGK
jgi:hypothetical protein